MIFTDSNIHDICCADTIVYPDNFVGCGMAAGDNRPLGSIKTRSKYKTCDGMAKVSFLTDKAKMREERL